MIQTRHPTKFISFGQAIISPDRKEIWAFWASNRQYEHPIIRFITSDQLLATATLSAEDDFASVEAHRDTYVYEDGNIWYAANSCVQLDFERSPMFIPAKHTGVNTSYEAATILLNDPFFRNFFGASNTGPRLDGVFERFEQFVGILKERRRKSK